MEFDDRIREIEETLNKRILRDPAAEAVHRYNDAVTQFDAWGAARRAVLDAERDSQARVDAEIAAIDQRIADLDGRLTQERARGNIDAQNALIDQRNAVVREANARVAAAKTERQAHNEAIRLYNEEHKERAKQLDTLLAQTKEEIREREQWEHNDGALALAHKVNELLRDAARAAETSPNAMARTIETIRGMRRTLGERAQHEQAERQDGMLITSATLSSNGSAIGKEPVYLCVDCASSLTAISPELVAALRLEAMVGNEVSLRLVNGLKIQARSIVLPGVSVDGSEANLVEGVVLQNDIAGVDGILGLSFLSRFQFRIERDRPQRLLLEPRRQQGQFKHDAFIAHKTADVEYARRVYDWLVSQGCAVFFSADAERGCLESQFQHEIDAALSSSAHLIVVASSPEYVEKGWVESEWRRFELLRMEDPKRNRHIVPVLCGDMKPEQLPLGLKGFIAVRLDEPGWQPKLIRLVQQVP